MQKEKKKKRKRNTSFNATRVKFINCVTNNWVSSTPEVAETESILLHLLWNWALTLAKNRTGWSSPWKTAQFVSMKSSINTYFSKGTFFFFLNTAGNTVIFPLHQPKQCLWHSLKPNISFWDVILNISQPCLRLRCNWSSVSGCSLTFTLDCSAQSEWIYSILLEMYFRQADQSAQEPYA